MSDVINVNISDAAVEICCQDGAFFDVLWQDEVNLNLDLNLMYIKSGQAEIQSYVDDVSKPEIDTYLNTQAEPIVVDVSSRIVTPLIDDYVTQTSKPDLDAFVEAKKPELQAYVSSAQEQANLATEQAEAAVAAKNGAASLAENAQASASAAEQSSLSAVAAQNSAAMSATQAQEFAEQASSASGGKANVDLDNLSSVGVAKFDAKQNTITGAATTIASANLTANRALIADGSGKVAVSAVTSTELGYLDGVTSSIQTQLNSKQAVGSYANTSLSNINTTGKSASVGWGLPNYNAGVGKSAGVTYTAETNGYVLYNVGGVTNANTFTVNSIRVGMTTQGQFSHAITILFPVSQGNTYRVDGHVSLFQFYPCKG